MPEKWDAASDRRLLLVVIQILSPSPPNWHDVAQMMGEGYTAESVRQHYHKLKKNAAGELGVANGTPPVTPSKSTPRKRNKKGTQDGDDDETPTSKRSKKAGEQNRDDAETPSAKRGKKAAEQNDEDAGEFSAKKDKQDKAAHPAYVKEEKEEEDLLI